MDLVLTALAVQLTNLAFFAWFQRSTLTRTLALWHQLVVYKRQLQHPRLKNSDPGAHWAPIRSPEIAGFSPHRVFG